MKNAKIVAINTGSSSIKISLFAITERGCLSLIISAKAAVAAESLQLRIYDSSGVVKNEKLLGKAELLQDIKKLLPLIFFELKTNLSQAEPWAIGHRVVHGGTQYVNPVIVDPQVRKTLQSFIPLAPLHQPLAIDAIDSCTEIFPGSTQVACFDTAFHRGHPWVADTYGLPQELFEKGVRRYGFHGLSYEFVYAKLQEMIPASTQRTIIAHLGNGASMCALQAGQSITSTMGFTPLDGLAMGTRCGQIDPGVILYLLEEKKMSAKEISNLLYHRSGLLGLSGISSNMQELLQSTEENAQRAVEYFVHRIVCSVGELVAALGGIDSFVFTGGIGEHAASIRKQVIERLKWLNFNLDDKANEEANGRMHRISSSTSEVEVWVIPTNEEEMIATLTFNLLSSKILEKP